MCLFSQFFDSLFWSLCFDLSFFLRKNHCCLSSVISFFLSPLSRSSFFFLSPQTFLSFSFRSFVSHLKQKLPFFSPLLYLPILTTLYTPFSVFCLFLFLFFLPSCFLHTLCLSSIFLSIVWVSFLFLCTNFLALVHYSHSSLSPFYLFLLFCSTSLSLIRYLFFLLPSLSLSLSSLLSLILTWFVCSSWMFSLFVFFHLLFPNFDFVLYVLFFWWSHFVLFRLSFLIVAMVFGVFLSTFASPVFLSFPLFWTKKPSFWRVWPVFCDSFFVHSRKKECLDSRKCFWKFRIVFHISLLCKILVPHTFHFSYVWKNISSFFELCFWWTSLFFCFFVFPFLTFSFSIFVSFLVNLPFCSLPVWKNHSLQFFQESCFLCSPSCVFLEKACVRKYLLSKKWFSWEKISSVSFFFFFIFFLITLFPFFNCPLNFPFFCVISTRSNPQTNRFLKKIFVFFFLNYLFLNFFEEGTYFEQENQKLSFDFIRNKNWFLQQTLLSKFTCVDDRMRHSVVIDLGRGTSGASSHLSFFLLFFEQTSPDVKKLCSLNFFLWAFCSSNCWYFSDFFASIVLQFFHGRNHLFLLSSPCFCFFFNLLFFFSPWALSWRSDGRRHKTRHQEKRVKPTVGMVTKVW